MNMEIEIISKSCVAPSLPTPPHLKTYKISLLDQFLSSLYSPVILFYPHTGRPNIISERSSSLKQSLCETLSRFYPLAGKVKDKFSIDCNDEGVCYIEAKCNLSLFEYLKKPDLKFLNKLLPNVTREFELPCGSYVILIQESSFSCGGFAIGVYFCHRVSDAISIFSFLNDWASTLRKSATTYPFLDGESIFPQDTAKEVSLLPTLFTPFLKKGNYITKRIVIRESFIAHLKTRASLYNSNNPTRFEAVIGFLGKRLMCTFKNQTGIHKTLAISFSVNLRRMFEPPIPECSLGNFITSGSAVFPAKDELGELVSHLREGKKRVNKNFLQKIGSREDGFLSYWQKMKETMDLFDGGAKEHVMFGSWCNLGIYETDFGMGKPIWVACYAPPAADDDESGSLNINWVNLMDRRIDQGVEAWITLKNDDFDALEKDYELLQYASIDPSPLYNYSSEL